MAWESRGRSKRRFFYRSVRVDGRVRKQYVGTLTDSIVRLVVRNEQLGKAERAAAVREVRSEQEEFGRLELQLKTLAKLVREVARALLITRGLRWKKGEWQAMAITKMRDHRAKELARDVPTREVFDDLVSLANRGDREASERLRKIVRTHPDIWQHIGDLSHHIETTLISMISQGSAVLKESLRAKVDDLRNSLSGEIRDAVDRLLVDHVVVTWLEVQHARMAAIQPQQRRGDARFWEERYQRANTRHQTAIRELVEIRELIGDTEGVERASLATDAAV